LIFLDFLWFEFFEVWRVLRFGGLEVWKFWSLEFGVFEFLFLRFEFGGLEGFLGGEFGDLSVPKLNRD
jgi:hypothetical protein